MHQILFIGLLFMAMAPSAQADPAAIVSLGEHKPDSPAMAPLATRNGHLKRKGSGGEPFEDATWWHVVRFNGGRVAVGIDQHDRHWTARTDLDGDGVVETSQLFRNSAPGPATFTGIIESTIEVERPGSLGGGTATVPYRLEITVQIEDEGPPTVIWTTDQFRMGRLPDGTAFAIYSAGGRYDLARARLVVDENGDDAPDYGNRLVHYRVSDGFLAARGTSWSLSLIHI